mmetsp:Transcript_75892/g.210635  ORF Transcript_75892/g.210635 Transcript_75892/m.210635 type:complete len:423 (-) Transcript_75892:70-1338(-)
MPSMAALSHCSSAPKYTLRGRPGDTRKIETPGPGAYGGSVEHVKYGTSPKYGFGGSPRDLKPTFNSPGPGQYTPSDIPKQNGAGHGFGGAGRRAISPNAESPGPGAYTHSPRVGNEGPKYSTGARRDISTPSSSPGPAAYYPPDPSAHAKDRQPQHSFAKSARGQTRAADAPGPGQYNYDSTSGGTAYGFGTSGRKDLPTKIEPGPGSYNVNALLGHEGPKFSAGSRSRQLNRSASETPGPGTYSQEGAPTKFGASPKFGFGSASRENLSTPNQPGPGQYTPLAATQKAAPQHRFGTSTRTGGGSPRNGVTPGPGTYVAPPKLGAEGPKYSAGGRLQVLRSPDTPGPGTYQDAGGSSPASPRFRFGTAARSSPRESSGPGPGTYEGKKHAPGPQHSFGSRITTSVDSRSPGPGSHEHSSMFT